MSEHKVREKQLRQLWEFLEERDKVLRDPTPENALTIWNKRGFPPPVNPLVPLATVHKARLHWLDATDAMLQESREWLLENGYKDTNQGMPPLTPETRDAQRKALGKLPLGLS